MELRTLDVVLEGFTYRAINSTEGYNLILAILIKIIVSKNSVDTCRRVWHIEYSIKWGIEHLGYRQTGFIK